MKRLLVALLLLPSLSYAQSFFDTSIAGGISNEQTPIGGIEMRYNLMVAEEFYISASGNFMLDQDKRGAIDMFLFPRIGLVDGVSDKTKATIGLTLQEDNVMLYGRIDHRVISTDRGSIGVILDMQESRIMIGIVFTNIIDKL